MRLLFGRDDDILKTKPGLVPHLRALADEVLSRLTSERGLVLDAHEGTAERLGGRLCLFAHFDPQGRVDPYVVRYLEALRKGGCDVVFISTTASPRAEGADAVLALCRQWILRRNIGLDFGSWRVGLTRVGKELESYDQLVLANDSVYGPFGDLQPIFAEMSSRRLDLWGLTETDEGRYHLQSYFLVFSQRAIRSSFFGEFWRTFRFYRGKRRVIQYYEIGLTSRAAAAGWKLGAYIPSAGLREEGRALNPTLHRWELLLEKHRFPFLKTEVLKSGRAGTDWGARVAAAGGDPELIRAHLKHIGARVP